MPQISENERQHWHRDVLPRLRALYPNEDVFIGMILSLTDSSSSAVRGWMHGRHAPSGDTLEAIRAHLEKLDAQRDAGEAALIAAYQGLDVVREMAVERRATRAAIIAEIERVRVKIRSMM